MMRTRFAPSPNGALHLGHAYAACQAHDLARQLGGAFLLRIEDIDGVRSRPELVEAIFDDLRVSVRARGVIFGGDLGAAGGGACPTTSSFDLGGHRAHR